MPSSPTPSPQVNVYERGSQAVIINAATGNVAQVGTAAPTAAQIYGLAPNIDNACLPFNISMQLDIGGTGAFSAGTAQLLGSLDGINFYPIGTTINLTGGAVKTFADTATVRYVSATIVGATVGSGAPTATVSIAL